MISNREKFLLGLATFTYVALVCDLLLPPLLDYLAQREMIGDK